MSGPARGIDWVEAERRELRRELLGFLGLAAFFVGMVLVTGGVGFATGGGAWAVVGVLLAFFLLMSAISRLTPRLRTKSSDGYRIQVALRQRIDPGPELRARTDRHARYMAGIAWVVWVVPLGPLDFLLDGRWNRPAAAAAGTVLLVGATSAWMLQVRRQVLAARRWVAEPPGPPREALPPTTAERWLTGRRGLAVLMGSAVAVGLIVGLIVALF